MAYTIMSFAEIKKAINSNLNKTLDALITEKASDNKAILNNSTYGLSALKSAMTGGKVPIVKSVQRGNITLSSTSKTGTVTISSVNTAKSIVILDGSGAKAGYSEYNPALVYLTSLSSTSFSWACERGAYDGGKASWQVIEFY